MMSDNKEVEIEILVAIDEAGLWVANGWEKSLTPEELNHDLQVQDALDVQFCDDGLYRKKLYKIRTKLPVPKFEILEINEVTIDEVETKTDR